MKWLKSNKNAIMAAALGATLAALVVTPLAAIGWRYVRGLLPVAK